MEDPKSKATDILPKNPHNPELFWKEELLAEGWQEGQDDTMKALRPILERIIDYLTDASKLDVDEVLVENGEIVAELEQILKES